MPHRLNTHLCLPPTNQACPFIWTRDSNPAALYPTRVLMPASVPYQISQAALAGTAPHQRQKPFSPRTREHHLSLQHRFTAPQNPPGHSQGWGMVRARRGASTGRGLGLMNQVWVCVTACLIHSFSTPAPPPTALCFLSRNHQLQMVPLLQSSQETSGPRDAERTGLPADDQICTSRPRMPLLLVRVLYFWSQPLSLSTQSTHARHTKPQLYISTYSCGSQSWLHTTVTWENSKEVLPF